MSCIKSLLGEEENDFGFRKLIADFKQCLSLEIIYQHYGEDENFLVNNQFIKMIQLIEDYIVSGLHSALYG